MMSSTKMRGIAVVAVAIGVAAGLWFVNRGGERGSEGAKVVAEKKTDGPVLGSGDASKENEVVVPAADAAVPAVPESPGGEEAAEATNASRDPADPLVASTVPGVQAARMGNNDPEVMKDLDKIVLMLRDYRTLMGENPVGTNAEIMKAMMGGNPKGAMVGPPEGLEVNGGRELVDRWGTPYFFHQLSKDLMEIHSAGPDRVMGTGDDLMMR